MAVTRDQIMAFIGEKTGESTAKIQDDTPLFSSNLIDSFSLVDLIMLIERECGIRVAATDVSLDNLDTIERILRFAQARATPQAN